MKTTYDFGDGRGAVPAERHVNPDGSEGGWVADTAFVVPTATVGHYARVSWAAQIRDIARVAGYAHVDGKAVVCGRALIAGSARVKGLARVGGGATVTRHATVAERAYIEGRATVGDFAHVASATIRDRAFIGEYARVDGRTVVGGASRIVGHALLRGPRDLLSGDDGTYTWDAWRDAEGHVWLRYGCEVRLLTVWPRVVAELCVRHGHPEGYVGPRAVIAYVRMMWEVGGRHDHP